MILICLFLGNKFTNKALRILAPVLAQCNALEMFGISKNSITHIEPEVALALADLPKLYRVVFVTISCDIVKITTLAGSQKSRTSPSWMRFEAMHAWSRLASPRSIESRCTSAASQKPARLHSRTHSPDDCQRST